jgi:glycosyltransferase involved in cell wall biosynthesis
MKIAQVAPLYEAVPPKLYGGTERVVHFLTEQLVRTGHDVTLFASGDSRSSAHLVPIVNNALRLNPDCSDPLVYHIIQLQEVIEQADEFDIIHFHTDYLNYPFSTLLPVPSVTTLHGRLDLPDLEPLYKKFYYPPLVSISNSQRKPLPMANFVATIYHGLPETLFSTGSGKGGYLAFLGRVSPEKGLEEAIEWAIGAGVPLRIAAKVDKADEEYFNVRIKPLIKHPLIEFIGEVNEKQKQDFLGNALALLFPINWNEPFGIVMIEAMACGTPVIAHNRGSVSEIITDGINGFLVGTTKEAVNVINQIERCPRQQVRKSFVQRFTAERMTADYLDVYKKIHRTWFGSQSTNSILNSEMEY